MRTLVAALVLAVLTASSARAQTTPAAALSEELRTLVKSERFQIVTSVRGLPLGVRDELQTMFGGQLDITDTGGEFQATGASDPKLPLRRLAVGGCSTYYCLVYYERGGATHTWQVALFNWTPKATRLEWGGTAPPGMKTIDEVRRAVLSGAIKSPNTVW
jgi:hypothetical protein